MTEQKYIDIEEMEKNAKKKDVQRSKEFQSSMDKLTEKTRQEREETTQLFLKVLQLEHEEKEQEKAIALEKEKAKAIAEVEARYEEQGVKSDHTLELEDAYSNLLSSIRLDD